MKPQRKTKTQNQSRDTVIYTRVSTDEQRDHGFSLQDQKEQLIRYCEREGFNIVKHYQEDHSAKDFNRPRFQEFLNDVYEKRIAPRYFVSVRADRFSRNTEESYRTIAELRLLNIEIIFMEGEGDRESPENSIMRAMNFALAEADNKRRSINTIRGMRQAAREGRCMGRAPLGYVNDKLDKSIKPHSVQAAFIKRAFEEMAKGAYSADELRKQLIEKGMQKCSKQTFLNILRNRFYCGLILIPGWKKELEQVVKGIHEPLITEDLFIDVQDILSGRRKNFPSTITLNGNLPLRGHLTCNLCGGKLTGSGSKSRNGNKHFYYHCQKGCGERFRADVANKAFEGFLRKFEIPLEILNLYQLILQDVFNQDETERLEQINLLNKQIKLNEEKMERLNDKWVDNKIEEPDYYKTKDRYEKEMSEVRTKREQLTIDKSSFQRHLEFGLSLLTNLSGFYEQSELTVKQRIIGSIFPESLVFCDKTYRTTKTNELLTLLTSNISELGSLKNEKAGISSGLSTLAPRPGLEPGTL